MRILVTGGAGYIGSVLVPALLKAGYPVTVLDSFLYGQTPLFHLCHNPRLTILRGDARDEALLRRALSSVDAIIPLACLTGAPLCARQPIEARSVNLDAIRLLLSVKAPEQKVLFPMTNSGYGVGDDTLCTEDSPLRPVSLYARLKVEAETMVLAQPNTLSFRLATVFGVSPRMRLDLLVNDLTYRAVTDGFLVLFEAEFRRNYIHVRDVARAFVHGLSHWKDMVGRAYNVGLSEANLTKRELCEEIRKQVPCAVFESALGHDPDRRDYLVSNVRIEATGFRARMSLQEGIRELRMAYRMLHRSWYQDGTAGAEPARCTNV